MRRRAFVKGLCTVSLAGWAAPLFADAWAEDQGTCAEGELRDFKSFGYYQGLAPNQTRSPSRNDGTYYNMPCIPAEDIELGEEKEYLFWHGHSRQHTFVLTPEHFEALRSGEEIEVYTSVVDGHRHALRVSPEEPC